MNVLEIEISSPHFGTKETLKIEAGVTRDLTPPLLLGNDIFSKYPDIFSRRASDAVNEDKIINRSGTSASRAEVETTENSSESRLALLPLHQL